MNITVSVNYRGMESSLKINLLEEMNQDHYLEIIRDHINIAKTVIDKHHENQKD